MGGGQARPAEKVRPAEDFRPGERQLGASWVPGAVLAALLYSLISHNKTGSLSLSSTIHVGKSRHSQVRRE